MHLRFTDVGWDLEFGACNSFVLEFKQGFGGLARSVAVDRFGLFWV